MGISMENRLNRYAKPQGSNDWGEDSIIRCRNNDDDVMVTVVCITYNHELYIAEALESFVSQITNFKFKVFVGDDCSTDSTPKIVQKYAEKYPDIIVPFLREENMGGMGKRNLISSKSSLIIWRNIQIIGFVFAKHGFRRQKIGIFLHITLQMMTEKGLSPIANRGTVSLRHR